MLLIAVRRKLAVRLTLLLTLFLPLLSVAADPEPPRAREGLIDLTNWSFDRDGGVDLRGQWEFYWGELRDSHSFLMDQSVPQYVEVPAYWNDYEGVPGGDGMATFRLTILVPVVEPLAIKLLSIGSAYELSIDGRLVTQVGALGESAADTLPSYEPKVVRFTPSSTRIELIFRVANFHHRSAGLWEVIRLGSDEVMISERQNAIALDLMLFGAILITALYNLGLWASRRDFTAGLYLGVFCLLVGARVLLVDERYIHTIIPGLPFELLTRIEYTTWFFTVPVFLGFLRSLFPAEVPVLSTRAFWTAGIAGAVLCSLLPIKLATELVPAYQVVTVLAIVHGLASVAVAGVRGKSGSILFGLGCLVLGYTAVNDILVNNALYDASIKLQYGTFFCILLQSILVSQRFGFAFRTIDQQSSLLKRTTIERSTQEKLRRAAEDKSRALSDEAYRADQLKRLGMVAYGLREQGGTKRELLLDSLMDRMVAATHDVRRRDKLMSVKRFITEFTASTFIDDLKELYPSIKFGFDYQVDDTRTEMDEVHLSTLLFMFLRYAAAGQPASARVSLFLSLVEGTDVSALSQHDAERFMAFELADDGHWVNHEHVMVAMNRVDGRELATDDEATASLEIALAMLEEYGGIVDFKASEPRTSITLYLPVSSAEHV